MPETLDDIDFSIEKYNKYTLTNEGSLFLRYDNKCKLKRTLIFMSECGIEWLRESFKNHGDGTFRSAPVFFFQFYVIFGQKNDMILPCLYAALPNKQTSTYVELIQAVKLIVSPLAGNCSSECI